MDLRRAWHSLRLRTIFNSKRRGNYVRKHKLFHYCGFNVRLPQMILPLHSKLISIHSNVEIASGVKLITHDAIHEVFNNEKDNCHIFKENLGCIEIMENVFIGANTIVLGNVRIGSNCIIGAGSLINKDIPSGSVAVGVPARIIGKTIELKEKRKILSSMTEKQLWELFDSNRQ